ncbi:MAG TPA: hypothetical protein DCP69_11035 [Candidatus Omnitrophica bacterium]|nr:hypothetical protein [Candidatus Omnitrophota bacterium]
MVFDRDQVEQTECLEERCQAAGVAYAGYQGLPELGGGLWLFTEQGFEQDVVALGRNAQVCAWG